MVATTARSHKNKYTQNQSRSHDAPTSKAETKRIRVLMPPKSWTAVRHEIFEDVLPHIPTTLGQIIYLLLCDATWHSYGDEKSTNASIAQLSRWTNSDWRSVKKCLIDLMQRNFVQCLSRGKSRSRSNRPRWVVPLAQFDIKQRSWTPVPRFLIRDYPRFYQNAILLVVLLWIQDWSPRNDCWAGVTFLAKHTGWSKRKIYQAEYILGHKEKWESLGKAAHDPGAGVVTPPPWSLEIFYNPERTVRHFKVRAVIYERSEGRRWPRVWLAPEFARHFGLETLSKNAAD
jgi:hypothetical protein